MKISWKMDVIGYTDLSQTIGVQYDYVEDGVSVTITKTFEISNDAVVDIDAMIKSRVPLAALKKAHELRRMKSSGSFSTEDDNRQGELLLG